MRSSEAWTTWSEPFVSAMRDFAAIDFETANEQRCSVCSVGVVVVRGPEDTEDAPVFPYVWEQIAPLVEGLPLVAHNACFDEGCLKEVFRVYRMDYPDYQFFDTLAASRRHFGGSLPNHKLDTVAAACGFDMTRHHHALADAEACAHIALKIL